MTSPFPDELISAYLDGELTTQEREYVEAQLRENAALRRMCDELRTLRRTLQALPVVEPPENLTERILRQAERRMLTGDQTPPAVPIEAAAARPATAPRILLHWRITLAVAATLAASILLFLWLPPFGSQRVAHAPPAAYQDPSNEAAHDDKLSVKLAVEESADSTSNFAVDAETAPKSSGSEAFRLGLQTSLSAAPAPAASGITAPAPAAPGIAASAENRFGMGRALSEQLPAAPPPDMAGAGGMPGGGRTAGVVPESDETNRAGGMGGGSGYGVGPAEPLTKEAAHPDMLMGPGMSGGSSARLVEVPEKSRGATAADAPRAGTADGRGDLPEMETTSVEPEDSATQAGEAPGEVAGAATDLRQAKKKMAAFGAVAGRQPLVNELMARFDSDAKLLIEVHGDPAELLPILRALPQVGQVVGQPTEALGRPLTRETNQPENVPPADAVMYDWFENAQYGSATHEGLAQAGRNLFVIQGSTDQIRETLTDLTSLSSVDIDMGPATHEVLRRRLRDLSTNAGVVLAPSQVAGPKPVEDAAAALLAAQDVAEKPARADSLNDRTERDKQDKQTAKDAASDKATVFLYFRLRPEVVPPAPAAKPDDR